MTEHATAGGAQAEFTNARSASNLCSALSRLGSTLTATETNLAAAGCARTRTPRSVSKEVFQSKWIDRGWDVYTQNVKRLVLLDNEWQERPFLNRGIVGVGIRSKYFAEGAERLVYELVELDANNLCLGYNGFRLVAKEHRFTEDERLTMDYHRLFCETQQRSQKLAVSFNSEVRRLLRAEGVEPEKIASIQFLDCCVYTFDENVSRACGILVEKMLNTAKYTKWNSNNGYVKDGSVVNSDHLAFLVESVSNLTLQDTTAAQSGSNGISKFLRPT